MDFPEVLGQILRSFAGGKEPTIGEYNEFAYKCVGFLHLSPAQRTVVISKRGKHEKESAQTFLVNELPHDFLMYLLGDLQIVASLLNTDIPDIRYLRRYKRQFLQKYFRELLGVNLKQRLLEKVNDIDPPLSFSDASQATRRDIEYYLWEKVTFVLPGQTISSQDSRIQMPIRLYRQDSKYDHPLLANEDLKTLHALATDKFGGIAREPFLEAVRNFLPQDIYANEEYIETPPDSKETSPEEVMATLCPEKQRPINPGEANQAKELAAMYWDMLRLEDRFVFAGRVLDLTDDKTKAWARSHGFRAVRFSDRREALKLDLSRFLQDLPERQRSAIVRLLVDKCQIFQQNFPLPPESGCEDSL